MVASRQLEIPYYRDVGRQRGRGFIALAQVIGRTAIPFLRKYIVPAAKGVGADLLEFAVPGTCSCASNVWNLQRLFVVERISRQLQRVWEERLWENSWAKGAAGNGEQAESFQQNLKNKSVGRGETFLQIVLVNHVE